MHIRALVHNRVPICVYIHICIYIYICIYRYTYRVLCPPSMWPYYALILTVAHARFLCPSQLRTGLKKAGCALSRVLLGCCPGIGFAIESPLVVDDVNPLVVVQIIAEISFPTVHRPKQSEIGLGLHTLGPKVSAMYIL